MATDGRTDDATHVVTAFLRNRGEVLLLKRSDDVGTYAGHWGGVSGYAEGDPEHQVRVEIAEETGLDDAVTLVRRAGPLHVRDEIRECARESEQRDQHLQNEQRDQHLQNEQRDDRDHGPNDDRISIREWIVHPFLFDAGTRDVTLSEEHDRYEWVSPTTILTGERRTVPRLWETYERVAPTVRSIAADGEHGAAWLSIRALEVLADRAGLLLAERNETTPDPADEWDELATLARRLVEARPSMAVLRNRVNRAMTAAVAAGERAADTRTAGEPPDAMAVHEATLTEIERAVTADEDAAELAAKTIDGAILTLSRSGTVLEAIRRASPERAYVAESRPEGEGLEVAESLAKSIPVTLHTDAAVATILSRSSVDRVVVGADTILPDGRVINKTGTRSTAIAAAFEDVPVTVVAATDKVSTDESVSLESGSGRAVYDGEARVDVANPTFDVTPAAVVDRIVTEDGALTTDEIDAVASHLRTLDGWRSVSE